MIVLFILLLAAGFALAAYILFRKARRRF
jgi:hypothetical protein